MKEKLILTAFTLAMLIAACNNQNKGAAVLSDPQQQEAVLDSIASNLALLQTVNEKAAARGTMSGMHMSGDASMMGMMNNPAMMSRMMDMMMAQCTRDTALCRQMCNRMMNNPEMMKMMHEMMMVTKAWIPHIKNEYESTNYLPWKRLTISSLPTSAPCIRK
jgi:hypothetical protein